MDYDNGFILQKAVDWSLLNGGMTIPVSVCSLFTPHHINYFTRSQNNDSTNINIISPCSSSARLLPSGRKNYHRIIHKNNPRFNRMNQRSTAEGKVKFQFKFENGKVLRLKLYEHLKF